MSGLVKDLLLSPLKAQTSSGFHLPLSFNTFLHCRQLQRTSVFRASIPSPVAIIATIGMGRDGPEISGVGLQEGEEPCYPNPTYNDAFLL